MEITRSKLEDALIDVLSQLLEDVDLADIEYVVSEALERLEEDEVLVETAEEEEERLLEDLDE